ncbi:MAG: Antilisterial bacteriocin subtilosin biosynthesis protein AlbA [Candidatus Izimaplasma bacterium HR2]|nr:MAG: Antilisterial bacteriocin subtilosin biosynthesis protein AlbA [Candidatus Izimaplasma bacterium HR2]
MYDKRMILRMGFDINVWKDIFKIHKYFRKDKSYNIFRGIKTALFILKNERIVRHDGTYIISTFMPAFGTEAFITNLKAVKNVDEPFKSQILSKRSAPISMYLEITKACNLKCEHCSSHYKCDKVEMTIEDWKKVVKEIQDMGVSDIGITGGEPLLKKGYIDLVKSISNKSRIILFTNGYYLTEEIAKQLKEAGLYAIGISLDSHIESVHNERRKDNFAYQKAIEAIEYANKAGLYTMIQTVILKDELNEDNIFDFFRKCAELNVDEVKILEPIRSGRYMVSDEGKKIFYDKASRSKLIGYQHKANKSRKYPKITTFAYTESQEKYGCGAGNQHSYINAYGDLMPCDFVPMKFGNVRENNVKKLWTEMNQALDGPKIGCFANRVNMKISKLGLSEYPLNKKDSCIICENHPKNGITEFEKLVG